MLFSSYQGQWQQTYNTVCLLTEKCVMIPGSPCERCTTLMRKQLKATQDHALFISYVVVFDMGKFHSFQFSGMTHSETGSTQILLTDLRDEAGELTGLQPGVSLEDLFDGSMFCLMDHTIWQTSAYSTSSVPVVIKHLTTTRKAKASADYSKLTCPLPALDADQMDSFIDVGNRMC